MKNLRILTFLLPIAQLNSEGEGPHNKSVHAFMALNLYSLL